MGMKYLIVGSGGTGGCIGAFLAESGRDVTFIARGAHLRAMREEGLYVDSGLKGMLHIREVKAYEDYEYQDKADIIFVCVKGYSLESVVPLIEKAAHAGTLIIPVLNLFGTGEKLSHVIRGAEILDGCIYIVGYIESPGHLVQSGKIFKLVYGPRPYQVIDERILLELRQDLEVSGIKVIQSDNMHKDAFEKFSFISSYAACGAYFDVAAKQMQIKGAVRDLLVRLQQEIKAIGEAMNIHFEEDLTRLNMRVVDALSPDTTASMQKDLRAGRESEIDGLVIEVTRLGRKWGVETPAYDLVVEKLMQ